MNWIKKLEKDTIYDLTDISDKNLKEFLKYIASLNAYKYTSAFKDFNHMKKYLKTNYAYYSSVGTWSLIMFSSSGAVKIKFDNINKIE